jgi:hypothetical protein
MASQHREAPRRVAPQMAQQSASLHGRAQSKQQHQQQQQQQHGMQRAQSAPTLSSNLFHKSWDELDRPRTANVHVRHHREAPFRCAPKAPSHRRAPTAMEVNRALHRPPPPVTTLASALKAEPLPRPNDRMMMHRVQTQLDLIQGSIAFPVRDKLDTAPGFNNLSRPKQARLRELLAVNPQLYNHSRYYTWKSRQVREMVDDIKLAAGSAAVVRMRVNRVRQAARQRCAHSLAPGGRAQTKSVGPAGLFRSLRSLPKRPPDRFQRRRRAWRCMLGVSSITHHTPFFSCLPATRSRTHTGTQACEASSSRNRPMILTAATEKYRARPDIVCVWIPRIIVVP